MKKEYMKPQVRKVIYISTSGMLCNSRDDISEADAESEGFQTEENSGWPNWKPLFSE